MSEPGPQSAPEGAPPAHARTRFEPIGMRPARVWGAVLYGLAAAGFGAFGAYMAFFQHHPFTAAQVMAPTIGAAWFAMRFVMMLSSR